MFSENLRNLRVKKGLTQKQAAEIFAVSQSTYALYENGKREPSFSTLIHMADYFEVSCDILLGHESKPLQMLTYANIIAVLIILMQTGLFTMESNPISTAIIPTDETIINFIDRWSAIRQLMEQASLDENSDIYCAWVEKQIRDYDYPIDRELQ